MADASMKPQHDRPHPESRQTGEGRAERDREPSMEEILASIKRIIADDTPAARAARRPAPEADDDILELTPEEAVVAEETAPAGGERDDGQDGAPLIEGEAARSLRNSLAALATLAEPGVPPQIVRAGETSLEGLTRELLRPMLKEWLDTNLPPIVEAMVSKEIQRVTRRG